ncbi:MAG: RNase J family beta-CASP ribonuclease [Actinobacteria bacterium HGW-Actinobacteria-1]|jgi:ribonuclease J|nr:MAG: RNase J family beta-CASP ribonuclease [Actinobacteria bacterium HGW-Actinobacteria-1]
MTTQKNRLRVIPLGGLDEIGKNMTVVEYGNDMVVIDAGIMFPDDDTPGVDLILPDYSYIVKRKDKLRGIIITHGHEDHTGALPYLLRDLGTAVPILGTKLTLGLIKGKLEEHRIKKPKLREIKPGGHVSLGVFGFDFIAMNHSIPDGVAVFVRTPVGNLLHTGDFKLDQTPIDGVPTDYAGLAKAARAGITLLMSDSTNAESLGHTPSEAVVGVTLRRIFDGADQRIIVASFASHIHRLQQVCDAAVAAGRKVAVTGRSMVNNTTIARELGYLHIADEDIVDAYAMQGLAADKVVVLSTGSQGEPLSALARMANRDHKTVEIEAGDTVVLSATPVPGNEKAVSRVINRLFKAGANVIHKGSAQVHVSGHAAAEELKLMLNLTKPTYFMPIHGETRHLHAHAKLAEAVGIPENNIFILENGQSLELNETHAKRGDHVESGVVYVDGINVGDIGEVVLRDRQLLSSDGIAMVVVAVDAQTGKVAGDAELVLRGLVLSGGEDEAVIAEARQRVAKVLQRTSKEGVTDHGVIKKALRDSLGQFIWERSRRRPMIIPIVMEV